MLKLWHKKNVAEAFSIAFLALTCASCDEFSEVDLKVKDVSFIKGDEIDRYFHYKGDNIFHMKEKGMDYFLVRLTSEPDLQDQAVKSGKVVMIKSFFCNRKREQVYLSVGSIYINGEQIGKKLAELLQANGQKSEKRFNDSNEYMIVIRAHSGEFVEIPKPLREFEEQSKYTEFDLRNIQDDVCVTLKTSSKLLTNETPVFVIGSMLLKDALERASK